MSKTLSALPAALPLYLQAVATSRRKPKGKPGIPALSVRVAGIRVDADNLAAYREICGFPSGDELPMTYPQVMAAPLQMHLMVQKQFPLPLMGIVHVRQQIEQVRAIRPDEVLELEVSTAESRDVRAGLEFDLVTEYRVGEELVWKGVTSVLYRMGGGPRKSGKTAPPPVPAQLAEYQSFDVPEDIGRRYAPISGDYNPIHLYPVTARMLGFERAIAHGLWSVARSLGLIQGLLAATPKTLDVQFKQPLFLPGKVAVKITKTAAGVEFVLLSRNSDKVHLTGLLG